MKGYIKIESVIHDGKEGLSVDTKLRDVTYMDRIAVIKGVCHALHITPTEMEMMAGLISSGLMDELMDTNILKNDDDEPQEAKKKKPNVHVVGLGPGGNSIAELLKMLLD